MTSKYPHLTSPLTIRGHTYRNRMIAAPTLFSHAVLFLPEIAENVYRMCENRARGGFAAVSTGEVSVNAEEGITLFVERPIDFAHHEGPDFEAFKQYADRIKKHGAIAYLEFCHEGSRAECKPPYEPWGPDDWVREDGVHVRAMNHEMMEKVRQDYLTIAKFARACGFDGVLVHGGHGFNMQQFISPWTNHRSDEFGGSMENRARFPRMLLEAVREGIGEEMILEFRWSAEDGVPGGMTIEDTLEFLPYIDGMADIVHISNGLKWLGNKTQTFSDFFDIHGVNVAHAARAKQVLKQSKVAVIGGINSPEQAEEIIAGGKADFVELGRQGFADPEFPNKVMEGREDSIRRCVRCFSCYPGFCEHETDVPLWEKLGPEEAGKIYSPASMGQCAINPESGFRFYPDRLPLPESARKVLIVGGGAGGLQAAVTARRRGHGVVLAEQSTRLGGTINFTDRDDDKVDLHNFKNLLIREAKESGADIRLDTPFTPALLAAVKPDAIIAAVGSHPIIPRIPGIEGAVSGLEVYELSDAEIGKRVVLIGGGLVGCEIGLHLVNSGHEVTVVEMLGTMANETFGYYRNALLDEMDKRGIKQLLNTRCLAVEPDGVRVEREGREEEIPADTVVYSVGMRGNADVLASIRAAAGDIPVFPVGDCSAMGKLGDAVRGGYMAAMAVV